MRRTVLFDSPAVRYGSRFGIATVMVGATLGVSIHVETPETIAWSLFLIPLFAILFAWACGEAGHWTVQRTGIMQSSILASVIAGGLGGLGYGVAKYATQYRLHPPKVAFFDIAAIVVHGISLNIITYMGLGAACDYVGASIGKSSYEKQKAATPTSTPPPDTSTPA